MQPRWQCSIDDQRPSAAGGREPEKWRKRAKEGQQKDSAGDDQINTNPIISRASRSAARWRSPCAQLWGNASGTPCANGGALRCAGAPQRAINKGNGWREPRQDIHAVRFKAAGHALLRHMRPADGGAQPRERRHVQKLHSEKRRERARDRKGVWRQSQNNSRV